MGRLIYSFGVSLDGYVADADGGFGWSAPAPDAHRISNEQTRKAAAFLFGRRLYELMEGYWPAAAERDDVPEVEAEFARLYVETPRIVFSDTLAEVGTGARLVRSADAVAEVRRLKREAGDLAVGGAALAASLFDEIDEFRLLVHPVVVGGGTPFFPVGRPHRPLALAESRTLDGGVLYLRYRAGDGAG